MHSEMFLTYTQSLVVMANPTQCVPPLPWVLAGRYDALVIPTSSLWFRIILNQVIGQTGRGTHGHLNPHLCLLIIIINNNNHKFLSTHFAMYQ